MPRIFQQSEATAAQRRFPVYLVDAADGLTPETGEATGQSQISKNGGAFANTTATLTAVGNGHYYVELTATELDTLGYIVVRYKSAATAEFNMDGQVVAYDPYAAADLGLTNLDALISSRMAEASINTTAGAVDAVTTVTTLTGHTAQTGDSFARLGAPVGASVSADIAAVKTEADKIALADAGAGVAGSVIEEVENRATPAQVNAEVLDVLNVDTFAEPGQSAPPATNSVVSKISYLYKAWRNLKDNDGSTTQLYNDAGTVVDQKQTTSEAAGTVTKAEWVSGP